MTGTSLSSSLIDSHITIGQLIEIGQISILAVAFFFRKYYGAEEVALQTKAHTALLTSQAETLQRLSNISTLQQTLLEKLDQRVETMERDFYVPVIGRRSESDTEG
jgi:hypothetical protein